MKFRYFYHYGFYSNTSRKKDVWGERIENDRDEWIWNSTERMFEITKEDYDVIRTLEKQIIAKEGREHHRPQRYVVKSSGYLALPKGKTIIACSISNGRTTLVAVPDGTGPRCNPSSLMLVRHSHH